jgi:hypothetical protein
MEHTLKKQTTKGIGGPGLWVEIDETHIATRKNQRGNYLQGQSTKNIYFYK